MQNNSQIENDDDGDDNQFCIHNSVRIILSHFVPLKNHLFAYLLKIIRHIMPIKIQKSCPIRKHRCVPEQFFVEFQKSSGH